MLPEEDVLVRAGTRALGHAVRVVLPPAQGGGGRRVHREDPHARPRAVRGQVDHLDSDAALVVDVGPSRQEPRVLLGDRVAPGVEERRRRRAAGRPLLYLGCSFESH